MKNAIIENDDACWARVLARDAAADGRFVYGIRTTGIYCRPACPSGPARRENVAFFAGCAEAEAAGFRACKRCRPEGRSDERASGESTSADA